VIWDGPDYAIRICRPHETVPMQDAMLEKEVVMVRRGSVRVRVRVGLECVLTTRAPPFLLLSPFPMPVPLRFRQPH
jgi:hypothetical protein